MNAPFIAPETVKQQIARLIAAHPELAEDEDFRRDVIEGETDLENVIERLIREDKALKAEIGGLKEFAAEVVARSGRKTERMQAVRDALVGILDAADLSKFKTASGTVSFGVSPRSVSISDEAALPTEFIRAKPNKAAIKEALEAGREVPGASLSNGGRSLRIA